MIEKFDVSTLLALKMEKEVTSQEMQMIYRSWKNKEMDSPLEHPESNSALMTP